MQELLETRVLPVHLDRKDPKDRGAPMVPEASLASPAHLDHQARRVLMEKRAGKDLLENKDCQESLDHRDQREDKAKAVSLVVQGQRERLETWVLLGKREQLADKESRARKAEGVQRVYQDHQDQMVKLDKMEIKVPKAPRELLENQEKRDRLVPGDSLASLVKMERSAALVHLEALETKAEMVLMVEMETLALLDNPARLVLLVDLVQKVLAVTREIRETKAWLATREKLDLVVQWGCRETLGQRGTRAHRDCKEMKDPKVTWDLLAQRVLLVQRERRVPQDPLETQVILVTRDSVVPVDPQDLLVTL